MDEADLILSFGYDEDVKAVVAQLPRIYQGMLMSATLSPELDDLKRIVLHRCVRGLGLRWMEEVVYIYGCIC